MRLDSVEIKVTLPRGQVAAATDALGLAADRPRWAIWFCEDVLRETDPATPLLDRGVVLRVRRKGPAGADGDATVKLRPARRSQLTRHWLGVGVEDDDRDLKVEADWAGPKHVLAAAYTAGLPAGALDAAAGSPAELFSDQQRQFLLDCAGTPVNLDTLTLLGPVNAVRWKEFRTRTDPDLEVRAERWTLAPDVDFLELSVVASPEQAPRHQAALERYVADRGLVPGEQETKTRLVLEKLVEAARA